MLVSSMSTGEIPGARSRWRAQTNPYAAQNLVRARTADPHWRTPINDRPDCRSCISGWARRLWRAQANPYAAKNLVRARLAGHADTPLSTLLTHFLTLPGSLCFTVRSSKPTPNSDPSVSIGVHLWFLPFHHIRYRTSKFGAHKSVEIDWSEPKGVESIGRGDVSAAPRGRSPR